MFLKTKIFLLHLLLSFNIIAQDNVGYDIFDITEIYNLNTAPWVLNTQMRDSIFTVFIAGPDSIIISHFFRKYEDGTLDEYSICDSLIYEVSCNDCSEFHVKSFLEDRTRQWVQISNNHYIARKEIEVDIRIYSLFFFRISDYTTAALNVNYLPGKLLITVYSQKFERNEWKAFKRAQ